MKTDYDIFIVLDAGQVFEPIKQLMEGVSADLSAMGVDEQIRIQSRMQFGIVTVEREMSEGELNQMKSIIHSTLLTSELSFRKSVVGVDIVRRKPGNVLQSVS